MSDDEHWTLENLAQAYGVAQVGWGVLQECAEIYGDGKTSAWLSALQQHQVVGADWDLEAKHFQDASSENLMNTYYRGVPHMLVHALKAAGTAPRMHEQAWILDMVKDAKDGADHRLIQDKNTPTRHRLQVFALLPAIQSLSFAAADVHAELNKLIAQLLNDTQQSAAGYSDSACEQINQIVPQILVDQLLAGPYAWAHLCVSDDVLSSLMQPLRDPGLTYRFEIGLRLALQFLVYYRWSLRWRGGSGTFAQRKTLKAFFDELATSQGDVALRLKAWTRALQSHVRDAQNKHRAHAGLARQSSAAVMPLALLATDQQHPMLPWFLSTNLLVVVHAFGTTDEDAICSRVKKFLTQLGVTRKMASDAIDICAIESTPLSGKARDFAAQFPEQRTVSDENPSILPFTRGMTMDELQSGLATLRHAQQPAHWMETSALSPEKLPFGHELVPLGRMLVHQLRGIRHVANKAAKIQAELDGEIDQIVRRAVARFPETTASMRQAH